MPIRSRPLRHRADSASRTRGLADGRDPCRRARAAAGAHLHPPPGAAHARGPLPVAVLTLARPTPVTVFAAGRVANGEGGLSASPAWVVVEDGRVVATGIGVAPEGEVEDVGDALLAPGFLDLQVNGVGAIDFEVAGVDDIVDAIDELVRHGCTGCLPTLITAPLDAYDGMLERVAAARRSRPDVVLGVHLEGPF